MAQSPKQLKKSDFLNAVTEAPMTRAELVESLEDFEFVASCLDYLTDHFVGQGKVVKNEDGTFNRKPRKGAEPKDVFRVVHRIADTDTDGVPDEVFEMETKQVTGGLSDEDKASGFSVTKGAAIKKACSAVFADYKTATAEIKELANAVDPVESDDEACDPAE